MKRSTNQRKAILDTLERAEGPLSAEEIHFQAQRLEPTLGIATVYRQLKNLTNEKSLSVVHLPEQSTRFELMSSKHHHHFFCESCENVFDIEGSCPVAALDGATLPSGFNVTSHRLTLYGVCSSCQ